MDSNPIVRFRFNLFNRQFTQLQIDASHILSIKWSTGQASSQAGRDRDDWLVFVRYRRAGAKRRNGSGDREVDVQVVGPAGPRIDADAVGRGLVAFLKTAGVVLSPIAGEYEFTTRDDTN